MLCRVTLHMGRSVGLLLLLCITIIVKLVSKSASLLLGELKKSFLGLLYLIVAAVRAYRGSRAACDPVNVSHLAARDRRVHVVVRLADELGVIAVHRHCIVLVIGIILPIGRSPVPLLRRIPLFVLRAGLHGRSARVLHRVCILAREAIG